MVRIWEFMIFPWKPSLKRECRWPATADRRGLHGPMAVDNPRKFLGEHVPYQQSIYSIYIYIYVYIYIYASNILIEYRMTIPFRVSRAIDPSYVWNRLVESFVPLPTMLAVFCSMFGWQNLLFVFCSWLFRLYLLFLLALVILGLSENGNHGLLPH